MKIKRIYVDDNFVRYLTEDNRHILTVAQNVYMEREDVETLVVIDDYNDSGFRTLGDLIIRFQPSTGDEWEINPEDLPAYPFVVD